MDNKMIQLDLFLEAETDPLKKKIGYVEMLANETKASTEKIRKSLHAKNNELEKKLRDLMNRFEILERNICNGN